MSSPQAHAGPQELPVPRPLSPGSDELVATAEALGPLLREHGARIEQDRRIAEACIQALTGAGLFRLAVPRRLGGFETSFRTFLEVIIELARWDGSTAWVTMLVNSSGWLCGLYPDRAQRDVFEDAPDTRICTVLAPTATSRAAPGGQVVSGRWGYASGCLHSQWAMLGVLVVDAEGEEVDQGIALVPMHDLLIEDTWQVVGMAGTGSNTIVAAEVFVPSYRILSTRAAAAGSYPTEHREEALYRAAFRPALALVLAGPPIGLARAALALVREALVAGRSVRPGQSTAGLAAVTQFQLVKAAQLVDGAYLHTMRAADDVDRAARSGDLLDLLQHARVRADVGTAVRHCREAVDVLLDLSGAGGFTVSNPLQRIWRDLEVASRHAVVNLETCADLYGRALLDVGEPAG